MKRAVAWVLVGWIGLSLSASAGAEARTGADERQAEASPGASDRRAGEDQKRHWDDVKASLRQGAYRQALQSLDTILAATPGDPWAQLYRSLCERRLKSSQTFAQLSPTQLATLKGQLQQEERSQRRFTVEQKMLERQLRREQAKWDQTVETLSRQVEREQKLKAQRATREAVEQARAEQAKAREAAHARAPTAEPTVPLVAPPPVKLLPIAPGTAADVELPKVIVPVEGPVPPTEPPTPSLVGRPPPPPGAAQINARQMSVAPDRHLAIAEGDAEVVFENTILTADRLTLFTDTNDVYAEGRVRLEEGTQVFRGEMAHYNFNTKKGRFLQGTVSSPPWHEHGRAVEHIAEGVYEVTPGYLTSCELEPPHFKFYGRRATVFSEDKLARMRNVALIVEQVPFFYLPWLSVADRQTPFFLIPGKRKPWGAFALMGYRYEMPGPANQKGTLRMDWRRNFRWGFGADHQFDDKRLGKGLLKVYYNENMNGTRQVADLPKGAKFDRYRVLWRHRWEPVKDTTVLTDLQKYSDVDFRKEFLFREEFVKEDAPESFISLVTNDPNYTITALVRKRLNRFQSVTEAFPNVSVATRSQRIGETNFYNSTTWSFANLQTQAAHSENDTDVVQTALTQGFRYALNWFRPIELSPTVAIHQAYHTKDKQGGAERPDGERDVFAGQFSAGTDASLKLFRLFEVTTNVLGLDLHRLRHVVTPTLAYSYVHRPTVPNGDLGFGTAASPTNQLTFGLENKLQTKRWIMPTKDTESQEVVPSQVAESKEKGGLQSVDLARFLLSAPYTFRGNHNKVGGELGDWSFDVEFYPWPWLRVESDWKYPSHFVKGSRDERLTGWNVDLVMVGGRGEVKAEEAPEIQAPVRRGFQPGRLGGLEFLLPQKQWYLGFGHRYSHNDKTEEVIQFDWRPSEKWEIGTFHRLDIKEVAGGSKRFNNMRERQYTLRRDLHDWIAELVYRVDREFGEEFFFTLTLKAYPEFPIEIDESYHQPKIGSQSSPFSPLRGEHPGT